MAADPQGSGQVGLGRRAPELLGKLPGRRTGLHHQLFDGPDDVKLPALVPEVPSNLAVNMRAGIGGQGAADGRIEVVDRRDQADVPHLHQVLGRLRTAPISLDAGPDQATVAADQQLARRYPPLAEARQRADDAQQLTVIQLGELTVRPACRSRRRWSRLAGRTCHGA
jgi:hypothetical protein